MKNNEQSKAKRLIARFLENRVLRQKNEWPAASIPIYYQPKRPTDKK